MPYLHCVVSEWADVFGAVVRCGGVREIFGPILPIIAVDDIDEAIGVINSKCVPLLAWPLVLGFFDLGAHTSLRPAPSSRPIPLVIYLFTNEEELKFKCASVNRACICGDMLIRVQSSNRPGAGSSLSTM